MDPALVSGLIYAGFGIVVGVLGKIAHANLTATPSTTPVTPASTTVPTPTAPVASTTPVVATNAAVAARFPMIHALFHSAQSAVQSGAANGFPVLTQIEQTLLSGMAGAAGTTATPTSLETAGLNALLAALQKQLPTTTTAVHAMTTAPATATVAGS